jgi:hypothetical protein
MKFTDRKVDVFAAVLIGSDTRCSAAAANRQRYRRKAADADRPCRRRAQIDDTAAHERATIGDPHHHGATVATIDDGDAGAEWQRAMGGGHAVRFHMLAACGLAAAVDRCETGPARWTVCVRGAGIVRVFVAS